MADIAELGFKADSSEIRRSSKDLKELNSTSKDTDKQLKGITSTIKKFVGALAIAGTIRAVVDANIEAQKVAAQLDATLKSTGRYTPELSAAMREYSSELQRVTAYGDEAITGAQGLLLSFTQIGGDIFPRATKSILDVATALGTDLKSATLQVGKALNDPILGMTALSRSGIQFSEAQKAMVKEMVEANNIVGAQEIILKELETQFGGSAVAARDTLGGALTALKESFGDLLEGDSGDEGIKGAKEAVEELIAVMNSPSTKQGFAVLVGGVMSVVSAVAQGIVKLQDFGVALGVIGARNYAEKLKKLRDEQKTLNSQLSTSGRIMGAIFNPFGISADAQKKRLAEVNKEIQQIIASQVESQQKLKTTGGGFDIAALAVDPVKTEEGASATNKLSAAQKAAAAEAKRLADEQKRVFESNESMVRSFQTSAATLGMTNIETTLFEMKLNGATQAQLESAAAALTQVDNYTKAAKATEEAAVAAKKWEEEVAAMKREIIDTAAPVNALVRELMELDKFEGFIDPELLATQRMAIQMQIEDFGKLKEKVSEFDEFQKNAIQGIQKGLADYLFDPAAEGFEGMAKGFGMMIKRMVAEAVAADLMKKMFGSNGGAGGSGDGWIGAAFGALGKIFSFEGGGFTGSGPRSGGMDGKGGFLSMVHPNETVVDHTKGQTTGGSTTVVVNINGGGNAPDVRRAAAQGAREGLRTINGAQRYA